jgi:hypothetical protein
MNIKQKFLELTSRTYPHGTEREIFPLLPNSLNEDEFGNLFIKIGQSDVMFTAHLDTATSANTPVVHVEEGDLIKTNGASILGADDKAGVTIMLYMIEKEIPGLYYFFLGEEVGCVGSKKVASKWKEEKIEGIKKVISFDRRGTNSVITFQSGSRCCSDKFGEELAKQLNSADETFSYKNDPTGLLTDSIQFMTMYPECTNISVGYQSEHTFSEQQNIVHLEKLAEACLKVDWNNLPVERDPSVVEYDDYSWGYRGGYSNYNFDYGNGWSSFSKTSPRQESIEKIWFHDSKFNYISQVEIEKYTKKIKSLDLSEERLEFETGLISKLLTSLEMQYTSLKWDGLRLLLNYDYGHSTDTTRDELLEYLPELDLKNIDPECTEFYELEFTSSKKNYIDSLYD